MLAYIEIEQDHYGLNHRLHFFKGTLEEFIKKLNQDFLEDVELLFSNSKQFTINCGGGIIINGFETDTEEYILIQANELGILIKSLINKLNSVEFEFENFKIKCIFEDSKIKYYLNEIEYNKRDLLIESFICQMRLKYA